MKAIVTIQFEVWGDSEEDLMDQALKVAKEMDDQEDNRTQVIEVRQMFKGIGNHKIIYNVRDTKETQNG